MLNWNQILYFMGGAGILSFITKRIFYAITKEDLKEYFEDKMIPIKNHQETLEDRIERLESSIIRLEDKIDKLPELILKLLSKR